MAEENIILETEERIITDLKTDGLMDELTDTASTLIRITVKPHYTGPKNNNNSLNCHSCKMFSFIFPN